MMNDSDEMMRQRQQQEQEKLQRFYNRVTDIYHNGYVASRGKEPYDKMIDGYAYACDFVNCYGHAVFNLTNKLLGNVLPAKMFSYFPGIKYDSKSKAEERLMIPPEQVGLKVTPWSVERSIGPNEWLVALYFDRNESKDFHFLLQEAPNIWSSKLGYTGYVELVYGLQPPKVYCSSMENNSYDLYGVYKITNQKARFCRIGDSKLYTEVNPKNSQCLIQVPGKLYYPDNREPIFDLEI